mgnify:CR=1 FL=1
MDLNDLVGKFELPPNKWGKKEIEDWLDLINMAEYRNVFGKSSLPFFQ